MTTKRPAEVVWVPVGGPCNVSCIHCTDPAVAPVTPERVNSVAQVQRPAVLVLTGPGEPTMRKDLDVLVHAARRGGASNVALVTNGRALSYDRVTMAIASLALSHIIVTILDPEEAVHDRITRTPGSFTQTRAGLALMARTARKRGTTVLVRTIPTKALEGKLGDLLDLATGSGAAGLWLDGPRDPRLERGQPAAGGVLWDREIDEFLLSGARDASGDDGHVAARMHPDEEAVSIVVRTGCRNACNFCTTRIIQESNRAQWPLDDLSVFHDSLEQGRSKGYESLRFVAIEPLEHPRIAELIARARKLGYTDIEAWTSARALADEPWAERLREAGLTSVDIPLLGSNADIHDAVAEAVGSFEETMKGLALAARLFQVRTHLVVTKPNVDDLGAIVEMAREAGLDDPASVLIPSPSSERPGLYAHFAASMTRIASAVASLETPLANVLLSRGIGSQIPPCILERTTGIDQSLVRSIRLPPADWIRDGNLDEPGAALKLRSRCPKSDRCDASDRCPGFHPIYSEVFGDDEFVPL